MKTTLVVIDEEDYQQDLRRPRENEDGLIFPKRILPPPPKLVIRFCRCSIQVDAIQELIDVLTEAKRVRGISLPMCALSERDQIDVPLQVDAVILEKR